MWTVHSTDLMLSELPVTLVINPPHEFIPRHALQLRQAKLAFSFVHLIVGVFSDEVLLQNGCTFIWPEIERLELVRHCRWVNEVTKDAPWELTLQFIQEKGIDFVAVDEGSSVDPNYDKVRVRGYDELKKHGILVGNIFSHKLIYPFLDYRTGY